MGSHLQKLVIFFSFILIFAGCSQNVPEVSGVFSAVIFDFEEGSDFPNARLSVFVQSDSDIKKFSSIKVSAPDQDYFWLTDEVTRLSKNSRNLVGNASFAMPLPYEIPAGNYQVSLQTYDDSEVSEIFSLLYNDDLYTKTSAEMEEYFLDNYGKKKIALYEENKSLIFYGDKTNEFQNDRAIWNRYRNCKYYRDIWISSSEKEICLLPLKTITFEIDN